MNELVYISLILAIVIGVIAVWRLFRLQSQLDSLLQGVRGALASGFLELDGNVINSRLQAISLFVKELLLRQHESNAARELYPVGGQRTIGSSEPISSPIHEIYSKLLQAIVGLGDISACATLRGDSSKFSMERMHFVGGTVDRRFEEGIISSAEEIIKRGSNHSGGPQIVPVEQLNGGARGLRVIGINSVLISSAQLRSSQELVLWLGLRRGRAMLSAADEERLKDLALSTQQLLLLVESLKRVLSDERENILGMSHDLRTPGITAMYVLNDLISSSELSDEVIGKLGVAERCLRDQLNGITEFVRRGNADGEITSLSVSRIDLLAAVSEVVSLYELQALARNVRFEFSNPQKLTIETDETILRRILSNIISNAAKYSAPGVVEVTIGNSGADLTLSIVNVVGGYSRQHDNSSLGVGLGVVGRLATMLGGSFSFQSLGNDRVEAKVELRSVVTSGDLTNDLDSIVFKKVLVVDDDEATVRMHSRYIREIAEDVDTAATAEDAVELLRSNHYDLILSDIMFRSGASVVAILNELARTGSETRVVLISGSLADDILLLNDKPVPRLVKPISRTDLLDIVRIEEIQGSKLRPNYSTI